MGSRQFHTVPDKCLSHILSCHPLIFCSFADPIIFDLVPDIFLECATFICVSTLRGSVDHLSFLQCVWHACHQASDHMPHPIARHMFYACGRPNLPESKPRLLFYRARLGGRMHRSAVARIETRPGSERAAGEVHTQPNSVARAFLVWHGHLSVFFVWGQREKSKLSHAVWFACIEVVVSETVWMLPESSEYHFPQMERLSHRSRALIPRTLCTFPARKL